MKYRGLLWAQSIAVLCTAAGAAEPVPPIVLHTTTAAYDSVRYEAGYMIADAWRSLGLDVTVAPLEFSQLLETIVQRGHFDAAIMGWSGRVDRLDPQFFLGLFASWQTTPGGGNRSGYANPQFDALYLAQARAFDPDARAELVRQAQALAVSDAPMAVLFYRDELVAYDSATFADLVVTPGDGLYSEWNMMQARPLTARRTLVIGGPQDPDNLNPLASTSGWGWKWMRLYYDTLIRLAPDAEPVLWAAETIEAVDMRTIDVTLRAGMTFHDGAPVTAEDVAFSFSYVNDQKFAYFDAYLEALETVTALDERTLRFVLKTPSASFAAIALSQVPILPRHIWSAIDVPRALAPEEVPTIGSGPFAFEAYAPGHAMTLTRNENHFFASSIAVEGLRFEIYPDMDAVADALLAGEIDLIAAALSPAQVPRIEAAPGIALVTAPDFGFQHLFFNTTRHAFADPAFRRALVMAIDRERIVDVLLEGRGTVGASVIAPVNAFWHDPDVETIPFDLDAARATLGAAGYGWDAEGRLLTP